MSDEARPIGIRWLTRRRYLLGAVLAVSLTGCASDTTGESTLTPAPREIVTSWLDERETKRRAAIDHFNKGTDAFEAGDYSRAMMHLEKSMHRFEALETAAKEEGEDYPTGSTTAELFGLVGRYYWTMKQAAAARYTAAYEHQVNDDPTASSQALERSTNRFQEAQRLKQRLRERLYTPEAG